MDGKRWRFSGSKVFYTKNNRIILGDLPYKNMNNEATEIIESNKLSARALP